MTQLSTTDVTRILMVDDEPLLLDATADLLRQSGYLVDTALDGLRGTALLEQNVYDFLITDLVMPGNRDLEMLHRAAENHPRMSIIIITGYPSVSTAREALQLPVVAYLLKPVDMEELQGHLQRGTANVRIHRTMTESRERTLGWLDEMSRMQQLLHHSPRALDQDTARTILGLSLANLSALLVDMNEIFEQSFKKGAVSEFCAITKCPRLGQYQEAVEEGIEVLERTKVLFKSKDLARLRERFQNLSTGIEI